MIDRSVLSLALLLFLIFGQNVPSVIARTGGTYFALAFTNLSRSTAGSPVLEEIHISSNETTIVEITILQNKSLSKQIQLNSTNNFAYTYPITTDISTPTEIDTYPFAVIVASSNNTPINIQVSKSINGKSAGYLAIPLYKRPSPLHTYNYYVPGCGCNVTSTPTCNETSTLTIVAVDNDTCVSVEHYDYKHDGSGKGTDFVKLKDMTMQDKQVFSLYSPNNLDYTGVYISARKPVAVFAGCINNTDYDVEQIPDVYNIKTESETETTYLLASIRDKPKPCVRFRVIASPDSSTKVVTSVSNMTAYDYDHGNYMKNESVINCTSPCTNAPCDLLRGQWTECHFSADIGHFVVVSVTCRDCQVIQYSCQSSGSYMLFVPPVSRYTNDSSVTFSTSKINGGDPAANNSLIIIAENYVDIQLNGTRVSSVNSEVWNNVTVSNGKQYNVINVNLPGNGFYRLSTPSKGSYTAVVSGYGVNNTAYAYLAGYNSNDQPGWDAFYFTLSSNAEPMTTISPGSLNDPTTERPPPDNRDLPVYRSVWIAEFTALDPSFGGKTADWECSNSYATYFYMRINRNLTEYLTSEILTASDQRLCPRDRIFISITGLEYYSEYSLSKGRFAVNITGNGTATLGDVSRCAEAVETRIRDPNEWISDFRSDKTTKFIRNDDTSFPSLKGCTTMYLSNPGKRLTKAASGWACPQVVPGVVYGAVGRLNPSLLWIFVTLVVSLVLESHFLLR